MGRMLLIVLLGASIIFTAFDLMNLESDSRTIDKVYSYYEETQARNLAASGIELAIKELNQDTSWSGTTTSLSYGSLNVLVTDTESNFPNTAGTGLSDRKQITSIGVVENKSITISAVVQIPSGSASIPPFFDYALASDGTISLNGNVTITESGNSGINANIHTNSTIQGNSNNTVNGFGSYSVAPNDAGILNRLSSVFSPVDNPDGIAGHYEAPEIEIPYFDAESYRSIATTVYHGNLRVKKNDNFTFGTKDNPTIYFVDGDLTIQGNTEISGYGVFVVKGNINIGGNVEVVSPDLTKNNIGMYTAQNINYNGAVNVHAQLFANGNISMRGNSKLYGIATARGLFNFNGTIDIYYKPGNEELTSDFWGTTTIDQLLLMSYYE